MSIPNFAFGEILPTFAVGLGLGAEAQSWKSAFGKLEKYNKYHAMCHVTYLAPDKECAQLLWGAHMNGLKAQAEEVVVREVVYAE